MKEINGERVIGGLNNNPDNIFRRLSVEGRAKIQMLNVANSELKRTSTHINLMKEKKLNSARRISLVGRVMFNEEVVDTRGKFVKE